MPRILLRDSSLARDIELNTYVIIKPLTEVITVRGFYKQIPVDLWGYPHAEGSAC
jgi:hypothetical protein